MGLINDGIRLMLALAAPAALLSLVLAGLALRREGHMNLALAGGGSFGKWVFWSVVFLTLPQLLMWFSFFGVGGPIPVGGGIGSAWMATFADDISVFVRTFVVERLAIVLAAWLVLRSTLDVAEGHTPLPSILGAMFLLAIPATDALLRAWNDGTRFATSAVLEGLWTYTAGRIMPVAAGLAIVGAIVNFAAGKPALRLIGCAAVFLMIAALWRLVVAMM
jgi:hypothetical protein